MERLIINFNDAEDKWLATARSFNIVQKFEEFRGKKKSIKVSWQEKGKSCAAYSDNKDCIMYRWGD